MGQDSKISWTHHTFNPWVGCTKVSAGCKNCYAEKLMDARYGKAKWGPNGTRVVKAESGWREPVRWNAWAANGTCHACGGKGCADCGGSGAEAESAGRPYRARVFCASLADVFEGPETMPADAVPVVSKARDRLFAIIHDTPHLDWLLLTKRPENVARMVEELCWPETGCPMFGEERPMLPGNVWIGTSVEDQAAADERIPKLLKVPAAVRFLSMEPLLGPVQLRTGVYNLPTTGEVRTYRAQGTTLDGIGWVIVGGESQHGARPMHPTWVRSIRDQCQAAGVAFHFKQWGEWAPADGSAGPIGIDGTEPLLDLDLDGTILTGKPGHGTGDWRAMYRVGVKRAGRLLDGRTWDELPSVPA